MALSRMGNRTLNSPYSEPYDFFSSHSGIVYMLYVDGHVKGVTPGTDMDTLHALSTINGRDSVGDH